MRFIFLISILFISSCKSVLVKECLEKDWVVEGMRDGSAGKAAANMDAFAKSCQRYKPAYLPKEQYAHGYQLGLQAFCTEKTGLEFGNKGNSFPDVCDGKKFPKMAAGYKQGLKDFCTLEQGQKRGLQGEHPNASCERNYAELYLKGYNVGLKTFCSKEQGILDAEHGNAVHDMCKKSLHSVYFIGYEQGSRTYCLDPHRGFKEGVEKKSMFANCPKDLAVAFQNAYSDGNTLKKDIDAKAEKLKNAERYLGEKERELQSIENQMKKMRARINENEDAIQRLSREIEQQKSRSLQGHDSFAKSRLNENQNKKDQLKRENNNISRFDLPNLVQQRQLNSFDVAKAREEILHWEEQLTKLKLKAQKNAR